jgi:hypothetical protein
MRRVALKVLHPSFSLKDGFYDKDIEEGKGAQMRQRKSFRLQVVEPEVMFPIFATNFKKAEEELLPLIIKEKRNPMQALIAIVLLTNHVITNGEAMSNEMIMGGVYLLKQLREKGHYTPSPEYPYTLEETCAFFADMEVNA